jgi:hypothetical protein
MITEKSAHGTLRKESSAERRGQEKGMEKVSAVFLDLGGGH